MLYGDTASPRQEQKMSKRTVVGLDPSAYAKATVTIACRRTQLTGGTLIGVATIDKPGIERAESGSGVGGGHYASEAREHHLKHAEEIAAQLISDFESTCKKENVDFESSIRTGSPVDVLIDESLSADLVMVGTRTFFHHETREAPGDTLGRLLDNHSCPVLAIPETSCRPDHILFAFDESPASGRAMRLFNYLSADFPDAPQITLLTVHDDREEGEALLVKPAQYLRSHGRQVKIMVRSGNPGEVVLKAAKEQENSLVVLGATNHSRLTRLIFGSVTHTLIEDGSLPLFICT